MGRKNRFKVADWKMCVLHIICEGEVGIAAQCKVVCCMFFIIAYIVCKVNACVAFFKWKIGTVNVHYFVVMQSCAVK